MANAIHDGNRVTTIIGVSSSDGITPVIPYVDPSTHRLLVNTTSGGLTIGTTTITSGTTTRILYDNAGVLGEYTITGTGTVVVMQASPTITGTLTSANYTLTSAGVGGYFTDGATNQYGMIQSGGITFKVANVNCWQIQDSPNTFRPVTDNSVGIGDSTHRITALNVVTINNGTTGTIGFGGTLNIAAAASYYWNGRASINSPSDGVIGLYNNGQTDFTRLQLGGTTSSFPSLKRSTTTIAFRLADDSADAGITAATGVFSGTVTTPLISTTNNAITASGNAATVPVTSSLSTVTNNSAATLTITITTASAVDGQRLIVRILDSSAAAQTITWVNIENSTVTAPTTSNGSTTLFLTVGFIYNSATSKWRCVASA